MLGHSKGEFNWEHHLKLYNAAWTFFVTNIMVTTSEFGFCLLPFQVIHFKWKHKIIKNWFYNSVAYSLTYSIDSCNCSMCLFMHRDKHYINSNNQKINSSMSFPTEKRKWFSYLTFAAWYLWKSWACFQKWEDSFSFVLWC